MNIEILHSPGHAAAKVTLLPGETLVAESGAMISMDTHLNVNTTSKTKGGGGFLKGLKRMMGGESFWMNHFSTSTEPGDILLAPTLVGDLMVYELDGDNELMVQGNSFVASADGVEIDTTWAGLKSSLFSGEGMFWLKLSGRGKVILNAFGGIYEKDVQNGYVVDTGHIVAFESTLKFDVRKAGKGLLDSFLGGEGLVCDFTGTGKLFCQTHNSPNFGWALGPHLRKRQA